MKSLVGVYALALAIPICLKADPLSYLQASGIVLAAGGLENGFTSQQYTGPIESAFSTSIPMLQVSSAGTASSAVATAFGSDSFGDIKTLVEGTTTCFAPGPQCGPTFADARAEARTDLVWSDTLAVINDDRITVPEVHVVLADVTFYSQVSSTMDCGPFDCSYFTKMWIVYNGQTDVLFNVTDTPDNHLNLRYVSAERTFNVGDTFQVFGELNSSVDVNGFVRGLPPGDAKIDLSHTALTGITVNTPGAAYTSASGHIYDISSVPEPSELLPGGLLLAFGLCLHGRHRQKVNSASIRRLRS
jgi:hypothetical protein